VEVEAAVEAADRRQEASLAQGLSKWRMMETVRGSFMKNVTVAGVPRDSHPPKVCMMLMIHGRSCFFVLTSRNVEQHRC